MFSKGLGTILVLHLVGRLSYTGKPTFSSVHKTAICNFPRKQLTITRCYAQTEIRVLTVTGLKQPWFQRCCLFQHFLQQLFLSTHPCQQQKQPSAPHQVTRSSLHLSNHCSSITVLPSILYKSTTTGASQG